MTTGQTPGWSVQVGPFGHGTCLIRRTADGHTMILAPPGVPLAPPEPVAELMSWRGAKWAHGRIAAGPTSLTLVEALERAPDQHTWMRERQDDADAALDSSGGAIAFAAATRGAGAVSAS
jgi:hypothetical protein